MERTPVDALHRNVQRPSNKFTAFEAMAPNFRWRATISQINMAAERLYTVILRDITQRKEVEEELERKKSAFAPCMNTLR